MKEKFKNNKGITLVALVVTIIILLILAGIAISTLSGDNGLFARAKQAKRETQIASIKEEILTDILAEQAGNEGDISEETLTEILEEYGTLTDEEELLEKTLTTKKGRYRIKVADIFNGTTTEGTEGNFEIQTFSTEENVPNINGFDKENTYYVTWDLNVQGTEYTINEKKMSENVAPKYWYNYSAGVNHWANIKTTGGGNDCYWVWIPRYAYKVPARSNTAQTMEIKFLKGTSNIPVGETEEITNTNPTPGNWVVHPAFTNSGNGGFGELTGIWVAKFEASSNSPSVVENPTAEQLNFDGGSDNDTELKVRVKPNVISWRAITAGDIFTVCKNLTTTGNSLEKTKNIDAHMMKNTEWGAVAYLSRSIYGKNGPVCNNNYCNNVTLFSTVTGLSANSVSSSEKGTFSLSNTIKYNKVCDSLASTTGNIYGIFDMAGGSLEIVAGVHSKKMTYEGRYDFSTMESKYYDVYDDYNNTVYGDAVYETSTATENSKSWYSDYSMFITESSGIVLRGGHACNDTNSGLFAFTRLSGYAYNAGGFRPTLVIPKK